MSLQGITIAMSPSGLKYFTKVLLAQKISTTLSKLSPPDKKIDVGSITITPGSKFVGGCYAEAVTVHLSRGSMSSFTPQFESISQEDNGQFTLVLSVSGFKANYNWNETYHQEGYCGPYGNDHPRVNVNYKYSVGFSKMIITVVFQFKFVNNVWDFDFIKVTHTSPAGSPNIPSESIVNKETYGGCFNKTVSDVTKKAVDTIDFSKTITDSIKPLFQSISSSGHLTPDIVFNFPMGPSGLTFPENKGLATGVTGNVSYKGKDYAGANPPQLALPPIPKDYHLNYFASDYSFNSLIWAFFESGALVTAVNPSDLPDPGVLNTANYENTPLQALFNKYPDLPMTADIKALVAPAVNFETVYELTKDNLKDIESQIPLKVYTRLNDMVGGVYLTEASFFTELINFIGQADADEYKTIIEGAARVNGAVVTHNNQAILNVLKDGQTIPVITFDVSQTDTLQELILGVSGTTQTLQFDFKIIVSLTTTKFISSTIPGITSGNFTTIWNSALQPVFATEMEKIGQAGVPLPRIKGFDFLFEKATITLETGYANVLTDVQHVNDNGIYYLMSKDLLDMDGKSDWKPKRIKMTPLKQKT